VTFPHRHERPVPTRQVDDFPIRNIFAEGELVRNSVIANFATTAADGKTYPSNLRVPKRLKASYPQ